jgi:hypothetical protein
VKQSAAAVGSDGSDGYVARLLTPLLPGVAGEALTQSAGVDGDLGELQKGRSRQDKQQTMW